jgi:allantoinase
MFDLAIKGNRIITPDGIQPAVVLIKDGLIADVVTVIPGEAVKKILDIHDNVLMPGITDPHVHINEPGRTEWEGFTTATRAALASGITTLVDMPLNAHPVTTTVAALEAKIRSANLFTNCGYWGGVVPGNVAELEPLIEKGVLGFKAFLTHSGIDDFPNVTEDDLRKAMPVIARHGLPLLVHCELSSPMPASLVGTYSAYLASRPAVWEENAISLMIRLCEEFNCRVHIVHLSAASALPQIIQAKAAGLPLTVETAQHYLYFNAENIPEGNMAFKCAPPIRDRENNELLWLALKSGIIDMVATDHSPSPPDLKQGGYPASWGGISSLQLALPALWTAARKRQVPLTQIAQWLCSAPALLAGTHKYKGKIAKGYDADLVIWHPEQSFTVIPEHLQHKHPITPYAHETLYGVVLQTYLKGVKVYDDGIYTAAPQGENILRS